MKPEAVHFYQTLGAQLRQQRTICGMTQKQLGDALGITFQQIQKYERGTNQISLFLLIEAARILRVPVTDFINHDIIEFESDDSIPTQRMRGALMGYFLKIKNPKVLKSVFEVVKVIAEHEL